MQYEKLENDIVAQLAPGLPGVDVLALPESIEEFNKAFKIGKVTIAYNGSKFASAKSTNALSQLETLEFQLIVQSRSLRGPIGVYAFLERIKQLILGYKLTNTDRIYLISQNLVVNGAKAESFTFDMVISCNRLVVEEINPATDADNEFDN